MKRVKTLMEIESYNNFEYNPNGFIIIKSAPLTTKEGKKVYVLYTCKYSTIKPHNKTGKRVFLLKNTLGIIKENNDGMLYSASCMFNRHFVGTGEGFITLNSKTEKTPFWWITIQKEDIQHTIRSLTSSIRNLSNIFIPN